MFTRKNALFLACAIALGAPLAATADGFWSLTHDEPGSRVIAPQFGKPYVTNEPADTAPLRLGDVSVDRQYVYLGEELGWQLRPMQFAYGHGGFMHVDDPVGHMHRMADTRPLSEQERIARLNSAGS